MTHANVMIDMEIRTMSKVELPRRHFRQIKFSFPFEDYNGHMSNMKLFILFGIITGAVSTPLDRGKL